ncbi:MAG: carboxypeptidase regulatory-like domain-containing protein [Planctomycetota bacterium]
MSRRVIISFSVVAALLVGWMGWMFWPTGRAYYTDADTIRQPSSTSALRDILWQPPKQIAFPPASSPHDYEPRLSADGLTLYFVRGKAGGNADIWRAKQTVNGWSDPQPLVFLNSNLDELGPEPSTDGDKLYFYSDRPGGFGGYDLWVARLDDAECEPENLGSAVNSEFNEYGPALWPDGQQLFFSSNRPRPGEDHRPPSGAWPATLRELHTHFDYDIYMTSSLPQGWTSAEALTALNTRFHDGAPAVSPVGDFLYFASDRTGGLGGFDLYRSRRLRGGFELPEPLGEPVNSLANELDPGLTLGGFGLCFSSDRVADSSSPTQPAEYHLYQTASREVFREVEYPPREPIQWAAIFQQIAPFLLWLLLALLFLAMLWVLAGAFRSRRLGLLAKCLLASLFAHMAILLWLTTVQVAASMGGTLTGRSLITVSLLPDAVAGDLSIQVRGLSSDQPPTLPNMNSSPMNESLPTMKASIPKFLETTTIASAVQPTPLQMESTSRDAMPNSQSPSMNSAKTPARDSSLEFHSKVTVPRETAEIAGQETQLQVAISQNFPDSTRADSQFAPRVLQVPAVVTPAISSKPGEALTPRSNPAWTEPAHRDATTATLVSSHPTPPIDSQPTNFAATIAVPSDSTESGATSQEPSIAVQVTQTLPSPDRQEFQPASSTGTPRPAVLVQSATHPSPIQSHQMPLGDVATSARGSQSVATPWGSMRSTPVPSDAKSIDLTLPTADSNPGKSTQEMTSSHSPVVASPLPGNTRSPMADPPTNLQTVQPIVSKTKHDANALPTSSSLVLATTRDARPSPFSEVTSLATSTNSIDPWSPSLSLPTETTAPPNPYPQRDEEQRPTLLKQMGGSDETERAVALALQWLAKHQEPDGSWSGYAFDSRCGGCDGQTNIHVDHAITGLSLLCFLGAGHTHVKDGNYRETVKKGLHWLRSHQDPKGDLRGDESMYSHAIATIALSEALGMTADPQLSLPVRKAIDFIHRARDTSVGGWRYDPGQPGDTSVLGWQVMAMKSAGLAGVSVPRENWEEASRWLELVSTPSRPGQYAYQPGSEPTVTMTAEGMFIQELLGLASSDARNQASAKFIAAHPPKWESGVNTYYWYYATLALFHKQDDQWKEWNRRLTKTLLKHQQKDGAKSGSWDPEGEWASVGGRVYQTAICTLMLEVYYRYLPLYSNTKPIDAIGTVTGHVTDSATGQPLSGATVRVDVSAGGPSAATTNDSGRFELEVPEVPEFFAMSASRPGYVPLSSNVSRDSVISKNTIVDFRLERLSTDSLAIETVPEVHHLGDDHFEGTINSQFQKRAEGAIYITQFELSAEHLATKPERLELQLLAKGVQRSHDIRINGISIPNRLDRAPEDGSFGEFTAEVDAAMLRPGSNTFEIRAGSLGNDIDDFEFVNVRLQWQRPTH